MADATKRYAVVTGANKGIGFETVRQLASAGINVLLTARDEKRGLEALERLKDVSELVTFHQLDVSDSASVISLSHFIKSHFGKLDILVNNAGILGITEGIDAAKASAYGGVIITTRQGRRFAQTYELAEECLQINYYGAKRTAESLLPLLQLSDSPTIVNVSSMRGKLEHISNEWAKGILSDAENLTEERIDEVLKEFLKDFREASLESKGWPKDFAAYTLSKAAMNAYTRILAKKCPSFCINSVCPGIVKTDMTSNGDYLPVEEGAASPVRLALLPKGSPSGLFYMRSQVSSF